MSEKETEAANSTPGYPTVSSGTSNLPPPPAPQSTVMTTSGQLPPSVASSLKDTTYWVVVPYAGQFVDASAVLQGTVVPPPKKKSLLDAYLLGLPLGFLGAHHFYLGRPAFGIMYMLSFGLLGCGWVIDLLRMPCLVSSVNKANREKYEQVQQLQQQLLQQHVQLEQQFGPAATVSAGVFHNVAFLPFEPRSLVDAYILWFPCGLLGYHHFYLRNYGMGILYHFTLGLLGIGWLIDLFRMPSLVREANSPRIRSWSKSYSQCTAHAFAVSPAGILGGHHFYLDRPLWGSLYACTFGLMGVGWVYDWFRTSCLVKRANAIRRGERLSDRKYLDDAYILCFPLGFTGLHHFYLRRYGWGILYLLTLGIFGIGWVVDWFRLPFLVKDYNASLELRQRLISGGSGIGSMVVSSGMASPTEVLATPPVYTHVAAGYGYYQTSYPGGGYAGGNHPAYMGQGYAAQAVAPPPYAATEENRSPDTKN